MVKDIQEAAHVWSCRTSERAGQGKLSAGKADDIFPLPGPVCLGVELKSPGLCRGEGPRLCLVLAEPWDAPRSTPQPFPGAAVKLTPSTSALPTELS